MSICRRVTKGVHYSTCSMVTRRLPASILMQPSIFMPLKSQGLRSSVQQLYSTTTLKQNTTPTERTGSGSGGVFAASVKGFLKKVGLFAGRTIIGNAKSFLFNCKMHADNPLWHTIGLIGTDFRSKQILLMLHIWMIHKRLLIEGKEGLAIQEAVFDELWEDTSNRIRGQGINELSVNKYLKEVQGYSFRCCVELDHALSLHRTSTAALSSTSDADRDEKLEDAEDKLVDDIAGVLWRLAYLRRDDIEIDHVLEFARYIRAEQQSLMTISKAAIFEARIQWGPLPWKADSSKGAPTVDGQWKEATAADGRTYYWNTLTRQSRWDKPADLSP